MEFEETEDTSYGRLEGSIGYGAPKLGGFYNRFQF